MRNLLFDRVVFFFRLESFILNDNKISSIIFFDVSLGSKIKFFLNLKYVYINNNRIL